MKRLVLVAAAVLLWLGAAAHSVEKLDIRVELQPDGSAWVTQTWDVRVTSDGTEWYIPVENLGPMTIGQLQVSENGTPFESLGDRWDVDRSRSWKAGKCGIVRKSKGAELCWGLGESGRHLWVVRFFLTGLVQAYDDADGFNFQFVNPGMASAPEEVRLTIVPGFECPAWTYDNTRVWGFGYYGTIDVVDGTVVASSSESFTSRSSLIALVRFEKGLFQPVVTRSGSFQVLVDNALEGSSYGEDEEDGGEKFFLLVFALVTLGAVFSAIYAGVSSALGYKWKKSLFGTKKITGWYRDIPLGGNLFAAAYLLAKGKRFEISAPANQLIGALFLRWVMDGHLTVQPDPRSEKRVNLSFHSDSVSSNSVEEDLYRWARAAAGDNQLLEKGEFEKWSTKNYRKMSEWPERAVKSGRSWFRAQGYFVKDDVCTPEGAREACHLVEFQNFLKDFTISGERGAGEVKLWKDYLVYAQLFGIADKVAKQFQKLYPAEFDKMARESGLDSSTLLYTMHWTNTMSTKAFNNAVAKTSSGSSRGFGGGSSFGGGGGFSGGGFGGGAR